MVHNFKILTYRTNDMLHLDLIGDFDEYQLNNYTHYRVNKVYDTIWVYNAHARIKNDIYKKGEVYYI